MKPASFTYHRPRQISEAMNLLETYGDDAKVIAGGQSLVPMMNMRLARPAHLVDINELSDLNYIRRTGDQLHIGALTRQADLERSGVLRAFCPIIPAAVRHIGHYAIRQRGTIGGSLAHADPSAELPLMATLLDANFTIISYGGARVASAGEFFVTIYTTDMLPTEILTEVEFPVLGMDDGWSYQEFSRRTGDFALVSAATVLNLDAMGRVQHIRMALGGTESVPVSVTQVANEYCGEMPTEAWISAVAGAVTEGLELNSDLQGTAEDRLDWLQGLVRKSLKESLHRLSRGGHAT